MALLDTTRTPSPPSHDSRERPGRPPANANTQNSSRLHANAGGGRSGQRQRGDTASPTPDTPPPTPQKFSAARAAGGGGGKRGRRGREEKEGERKGRGEEREEKRERGAARRCAPSAGKTPGTNANTPPTLAKPVGPAPTRWAAPATIVRPRGDVASSSERCRGH